MSYPHDPRLRGGRPGHTGRGQERFLPRCFWPSCTADKNRVTRRPAPSAGSRRAVAASRSVVKGSKQPEPVGIARVRTYNRRMNATVLRDLKYAAGELSLRA